MTEKDSYDTLREACIQEAMHIIETSGIEKLSMREVARRLGVSHQAPYKHFPSRDHILAEILKRAFEDFATHLDSRPHSENPHHDLSAMGHAYLRYAAEHPLQYRLMFGTPLPDPAEHPEMMAKAQHAYALLREAIEKMALATSPEIDALFVWSTMHGLASILQLQMFEQLSVSAQNPDVMIQQVIARIGTGIEPR